MFKNLNCLIGIPIINVYTLYFCIKFDCLNCFFKRSASYHFNALEFINWRTFQFFQLLLSFKLQFRNFINKKLNCSPIYIINWWFPIPWGISHPIYKFETFKMIWRSSFEKNNLGDQILYINLVKKRRLSALLRTVPPITAPYPMTVVPDCCISKFVHNGDFNRLIQILQLEMPISSKVQTGPKEAFQCTFFFCDHQRKIINQTNLQKHVSWEWVVIL